MFKFGWVSVVFVVAVLGAAVWFGIEFNQRGKDIDVTTKTLGLTRDTLRGVREDLSMLAATNADLQVTNADLKVRNGQLVTANAEAKSKALVASMQLQQTSRQLQASNRALSARDAKLAADEEIGGVGVVGTTEADSAQNRQYAILKAQIKYYQDVVIPGLQQTIAKLEGEKSELEVALNGKDGANAEVINLRQQLADARLFVQDKRTKLSKGLGKLFKAGQIRVLGEVDDTLRRKQARRADSAVAREQ